MVLDRARTRPVVGLTGARQTGKTSLVRRLFPTHDYVSLDLPSEAEQAENDPSAFLSRHPAPLIVDEVQYAPGLLRHLKREVDARRDDNGRFILTGSQPFELMTGVAESLAGRAAVLTLGGLSYAEILRARPETTVEEAILRGGFPELHAKPDIDARGFFQSYVATRLAMRPPPYRSPRSLRFSPEPSRAGCPNHDRRMPAVLMTSLCSSG